MNLVTVWLLTVALHASVLLACASAIDRFVRRDTWRELLWRCALFGGALTATLQVASQHVPLGGRLALHSAAPIAQTAPVSDDVVATASAPPVAHTLQTPLITTNFTAPAPVSKSWRDAWTSHWPAALFWFWLAGATFASLRVAIKLSQLHGDTRTAMALHDERLLSDAAALADDAAVPVPRLLQLDGLASPIALTGARIVLPSWAVATLEPAALRAMLAHELGHIVRRDPQMKLLIAGWRALFWFVPLTVIAQRCLDDIAELACDAFAARHIGDGRELAECLVACGEHHVSGPAFSLAPAMAAHASSLINRIERLLEGDSMDHQRLSVGIRAAAVVALAAAAFCLPGVGLDIARADTPQTSDTKPAKHEHSSSSVHLSLTDDAGSNNTIVSFSNDKQKFSANIHGKIQFGDDEADVKSLEGNATFEDVRDGVAHRIDVSGGGTNMQRRYFVDNKEHPYDDDARAWMKRIVLDMMRSGVDAEARVKRLYNQGGAERVLAEIDEMTSDYARRVYVVELVGLGKLSDAQLDRVIAICGALSGDYERREAMTALFNKQLLDAQRQVEFLHQALRFDGDYERAELLVGVLPRLVDTPQVRQAWLDAGLQVKDDYERRRTLEAIVARGLDDRQLASVIEAGASIRGDYEKRTLLVAVAEHAHDIDALAPAYVKALQNMRGDYEHKEALLALIHSGRLGERGLPAVLDSAGAIKSAYECREVLVALAPSIGSNSVLAARYRQIASALPAYERGEAERMLR